MKIDRTVIRFTITVQMLYINGHIKEPSPPKSLDIFLLCPTVDPQLRVDARSGKHNIAPVSAHKHQIRLRVRIILDRVQKDLGEYFYRDKAGFAMSRQLIEFVPRHRMTAFVKSGREGGCVIHGQAKVAQVDVRPVRPVGVRIHGEWWIWVWVGFRDLTGIDSSALGDGMSQRMLEVDHSARRTGNVWPGPGGQDSLLRLRFP